MTAREDARSAPPCGAGHLCCSDPNGPPLHDHFLPTEDCPRCVAIRSRRHTFQDGIRLDECVLHVEPTLPLFEGLMVEHPGCEELGDVSADLDAWYCTACSRSGRISGAWAVDMWEAADARA